MSARGDDASRSAAGGGADRSPDPSSHGAGPPRRSGARRLGRGLVLAGLALLSALAAVEAAVRLLVGAPMPERLPIVRVRANELRGWEMMPDEPHYTYDHRVHVNELGLRGPEIGPKAPDEVRILTLGDSLLYGQGVADDQTVPHHLEAILDARDAPDRTWTVVNGGHRAYATHQELGLLHELGDEIDPDVVIVFWFWNDLYERNVSATYARLKEKGPVAFDVGAEVEGWTRLRWTAKQLLRRSAAVMYLYDLYRASGAGPPKPRAVEDGMVRFEKYLERFVRATERRGARLVYAVVPEPGGLLAEHFTHAIDARAIETLRTHGVPTIVFGAELSELARERGRLPVLPFDGHYTGEANRVMAEVVARELTAE